MCRPVRWLRENGSPPPIPPRIWSFTEPFQKSAALRIPTLSMPSRLLRQDFPFLRSARRTPIISTAIFHVRENNTGKVIVETLHQMDTDIMAIPAILVKNHGPFTWGKNAAESVYHAVVLETIAEMAMKTMQLNPKSELKQYVLDKHYFRKHGAGAYYGQG